MHLKVVGRPFGQHLMGIGDPLGNAHRLLEALWALLPKKSGAPQGAFLATSPDVLIGCVKRKNL
jgi:hypothetical protein